VGGFKLNLYKKYKSIKNMKIILASQSKERIKIFSKLGIEFESISSSFDENPLQKELINPYELVQRLAEGKANSIGINNPNSIIVSGDTVCVYNNNVLGKPKDKEEAKEMLQNLSGNTHKFISGYCILNTDTQTKDIGFEECEITFRNLSEKEIDDFLKEDICLEKAGAYQIFGAKSETFISKINGSFNTCNGMPIG
jgi:septum formation protein